MTLQVPLAVRVKTDRTERDITNLLRDLRTRAAVPGGFGSIQLAFDHPLVFRPDEVAYYAGVYVVDARNGRLVCEGRLEDPERHADASGEIWGLTAIGPAAHATDRMLPLIYVDKLANDWVRADNSVTKTYLDTVQDTKSSADDGWRLSFERGKTVPVGNHGGIEYQMIRDAGQKFARISYSYDPDNTDANWRHRLFLVDGGIDNPVDIGFNTGAGSVAKVVGTDWTAGRQRARIQLGRNTSSVAITTDDGNAWFTNIIVRAMLVDANGADRTPSGTGSTLYSYSTNTILAEDVVRDVLGRMLPKYDKSTLSIAASSFAIEQLAYPDGVTAAQIFDDLMMLEPNTFWAAWESNSSGSYRFVWQTWPTSVDYEASTVDGFDSPASAVDLYNEVLVRYKGPRDTIATITRTLSVSQLTSAGLTRTAFIDLGDEPGGPANAAQVGDLFLSDHQYPPNKGSLTISRPILSRSEGRMVAPWEIRPGRLIRVQDVEPTVDGLNATARDGVTVFRVVSVEYDAASNSAQLELDSFTRTTARALAALQANPALVRRRR